MKNRIRLFSLFLALLLVLGGCQKGSSPDGQTNNKGDSQGNNAADSSDNADADVSFAKSISEMITNRDYEVGYDENESIRIQLNGSSASCSSDAVKISGNTVTITDEGTYILSGTLNNGMIVVNAEDNDKPQIVLDNVTITSETSAPIYILEADKVFITLAEGSSNTLSNGGTFTAIDKNNIDGAVFSKQDLTFNGSGTLTVNSPGGHGIVCKDDLVFTSGTYTVNSASHGLDANDSVRIVNAAITIAAGKDGIHTENNDDTSLGFFYAASGTLDISAEGDGISAGAYTQIEGGSFTITSGGGSENSTKEHSDSWGGFMGGRGGRSQSSSASGSTTDDSSSSLKGIKSAGSMLINDGTFTIDSADDSIHSNASITINGGAFAMASGDDGIHADGTLVITSGTIHISESYEGLEALHLKISGGDIDLVASDDGLNAAGGTDSSGTTGGRDGMFGGGPGGGMGGGPGGGGMGGGPGGGMGSSSSNGSILISGGTLYINASGDGIDANGTLEISGGHITVCGPTQGDTATLDYDVSGIITGGTFIGTGASGMAQSFSDSEQGVVAVSVGNQSAGTTVTLKDSDGNTLFSFEPELSFAVVILSSPELVKGESYTITVGSSGGDVTAD